ncbi:MAG TPA: hypothetical protein VGH89_35555 [Pseudonocardia sp.]|jgi:hypothetical protein
MTSPWRQPHQREKRGSVPVLSSLLAAAVLVGCALGPVQRGPAAAPRPAALSTTARGPVVPPAPPPSQPGAVSSQLTSCAASWAQTGVLAGLFTIPAAPTGINVCGPGTLRPAPMPAGCTAMVAATALQAAVNAAGPGSRICTEGNSPQRLTVTRSGSAQAPIQILGIGQTSVKGITVQASNVVVAGLNAALAVAPGIQLTGDNITLLNNTITSPRGGDGDGIRFFGNNLNILHNTVTDVRNLGGAHADCMQTYATNTPTSQHVLISSNRCVHVDNQCLIAEGPNSSAGDGSGKGQSSDITFTNNFCDTDASQALMIDDVQNVVVIGNAITGGNAKAFAFANKSTGAVVSNNAVAKTIGYLVGMDSSSQPGYQGPPVGGKP